MFFLLLSWLLVGHVRTVTTPRDIARSIFGRIVMEIILAVAHVLMHLALVPVLAAFFPSCPGIQLLLVAAADGAQTAVLHVRDLLARFFLALSLLVLEFLHLGFIPLAVQRVYFQARECVNQIFSKHVQFLRIRPICPAVVVDDQFVVRRVRGR